MSGQLAPKSSTFKKLQLARRFFAAARELVVVNRNGFRVRIELRIAERLLRGLVTDHGQVDRLIVSRSVAEDFDLVAGHHHDAGPGRHLGHDITCGAKFAWLFFRTRLSNTRHCRPPFCTRSGSVKTRMPPALSVSVVFVDVGRDTVLDLDAGHVFVSPVAADDDLLRLADVNACV